MNYTTAQRKRIQNMPCTIGEQCACKLLGLIPTTNVYEYLKDLISEAHLRQNMRWYFVFSVFVLAHVAYVWCRNAHLHTIEQQKPTTR